MWRPKNAGSYLFLHRNDLGTSLFIAHSGGAFKVKVPCCPLRFVEGHAPASSAAARRACPALPAELSGGSIGMTVPG
jgi:hypothetical protein